MKKYFKLIGLILSSLFLVVLASCGGGGEKPTSNSGTPTNTSSGEKISSSQTTPTASTSGGSSTSTSKADDEISVTINYGGGVTEVVKTVNKKLTFVPTKSGHVFSGYYTDETMFNYFDSNTTINSKIELFVSWSEEKSSTRELDAPKILSLKNDELSWSIVDNAEEYKVEVYFNNKIITNTSQQETSYRFLEFEPGTYKIKITALGDGVNYVNSKTVNRTYKNKVIADPTNLKFDNDSSTITFKGVAEAEYYEVYVGNKLFATTEETSVNVSKLDTGNYAVTVVSCKEGYYSGYAELSITKTALKAPSVDIDYDLDNEEYVLTIEKIKNATNYILDFGNNNKFDITALEYKVPVSSELWTGDNISFTLNCYNTNGQYLPSTSDEKYKLSKLVEINLSTELSWANGKPYVEAYVMQRNQVVYNYNYTGAPEPYVQTLTKDEHMNPYAFETPSREGYLFLGWFTDKDCTIPYEFTKEEYVIGELDLYAGWYKKPNNYVDYSIYDGSDDEHTLTTTISNSKKIEIVFTLDTLTNPSIMFLGIRQTTTTFELYDLTDNNTLVRSHTMGNYVFESVDAAYSAIRGHAYKLVITGDKSGNWPNGYTISLTMRKGRNIAISNLPSSPSYSTYNKVTVVKNNFITRNDSIISSNIANLTVTGWYDGSSLISREKSIEASKLVGKNAFVSYSFDRNNAEFIGSYSDRNITTGHNSDEFDGKQDIPMYIYDGASGFVSVSGLVINSSKLTEYVVPSYIKRVEFSNCKNLTKITLPEGLTTISSSAFAGCKSLAEIVIPNTVTSIGSSAFSGCRSLTSITIPNSVTSIGDYAFDECYKIVEVYNLSLLNITAGSTDNGYIGYYAKVIHTSLDEKSIITKDDNGYIFAYYDNKGYLIGYEGNDTELTLPNSFTYDNKVINSYEINQHAFYNNETLTSITIPEGVTSIGSGAFSRCSSLTSITIPEGVTSIGSSAFEYCSSLTSITIPNSVTSIGNSAFSGCTSLTSITIPDSVTSIGSRAFSNCSSLTSITIPDSVTSIGSSAFYFCTSLTSITIPDSVTSIDGHAFDNCSSLTSITIPKGVTSIGNWAFDRCTSLTSITFEGTIAQWNAITKGIAWIYNVSATVVHCTDGEIDL